MTKKNTLIPRLRFPEFKDDGEWEEKKLGEVFTTYSGGTPSTIEKKYYDGDIPFIRSAEIGKKSTELFLAEIGLKNSSAKMVNKGDLLVALYGANSGDVAISQINGAINQAVLCLKSEFSNVFTYHFLSLKKDWIVSRYIQGGQGNLSGDIIKSIVLAFPQPKEQQRIASCLSSLDNLIDAHSQKLDLLKEHKKGLMQNLFPREGEKVPRLRFPEFKKDGEWEEKKLGEVAEIVRGGSPRPIQDYITNSKDGLKWLKIADVAPDSKYITGTKERVIKEALNSTREVHPGDLILSNSMSFGRPYILKIKTCIHDGWIAIRKISNKTFEDYLYYYISSENSQSYFNTNAAGAAVKNLNADIIKLLFIQFPQNIKEQQCIASCLSSLDELITAQGEKIEQLKEHKTGLMQGLFPGQGLER